MSRPRIFLDTNVYISNKRLCYFLFEMAQKGRIEIITSARLRAECMVDRGWETVAADLQQELSNPASASTVPLTSQEEQRVAAVSKTARAHGVPDTGDDHIAAAAIVTKVDYLVTANLKDLKAAEEIPGTKLRVLTQNELFEALRRDIGDKALLDTAWGIARSTTKGPSLYSALLRLSDSTDLELSVINDFVKDAMGASMTEVYAAERNALYTKWTVEANGTDFSTAIEVVEHLVSPACTGTPQKRAIRISEVAVLSQDSEQEEIIKCADRSQLGPLVRKEIQAIHDKAGLLSPEERAWLFKHDSPLKPEIEPNQLANLSLSAAAIVVTAPNLAITAQPLLDASAPTNTPEMPGLG